MIVGHIGGGVAQGYEIEKSLRFRASNSAYLSRTPGVAGNQKTWTWSGWFKRGNLGAGNTLFAAGAGAAECGLYFTTTGQLHFDLGFSSYRISASLFRDPTAYYHLVAVCNTSDAVAQQRARLYINGVEIASWISNVTVPLDASFAVNSITEHNHGRWLYSLPSLANPFDGYLSEINFIDGQAITPDAFGESVNGVWVPKKYTGTYGTNGFYLPFNDGSNLTELTKDRSGNANNWTASGISLTSGATYDWMDDTPTNNFAVLSPLNAAPTAAPSAGNLLAAHTSGATASRVGSSVAVNVGKWYWEATVVAKNNPTYPNVGIVPADVAFSNSGSVDLSGTSGAKCIRGDGTNQAGGTYGGALTAGMVLGFALDMDAGTVVVYENNVSQGTLASGLSGSYVAASGSYNNSNVQFNFGQRPFAYTPPTGFKALCTKNLPAPAIANPREHFDVRLFTNSSGTTVTGAQFQPDFVWGKNRGGAGSHWLYDGVRGATKQLSSDLTSAENTANDGLTAFTSDGFVLGNRPEVTGGSLVSWLWKAGGAPVSNTAGSITSQVSANVDAGFSIVTWMGPGGAGTVGHGLNITPKFVFYKARGTTSDWWTLTTVVDGSLDFLKLNTTDAKNDQPGISLTSTTIPNWNFGTTMVAYCFAEVQQYSRIGSYVGNGSADGPFVWCGFRPRFVMVKRADGVSGWQIQDAVRGMSNVINDSLHANSALGEGTLGAYPIDFLANGFKLRNTSEFNTNGGTYIFLAFAEQPFSAPSNAR